MSAEEILEQELGLNQELGYKSITREDIFRCVVRALEVKKEEILITVSEILTDDFVNTMIKNYGENWKTNNPNYPENDYLSGINDGVYLLRNWLTKQSIDNQ